MNVLGAIPNAFGGAAVGGLVGGERNLAEDTGLNRWLTEKGLPAIQPDTLALGGLSNPAALGGMAAQAALPATAVDDLAGLLLRQGARVTTPLVERFMREVGPGQIRVALERGTTGLADLFDDFVARTAEAVPGGREGPLGRILAEEEGGLRLPRLGRAAATPPPPPATPGNGAPSPTPRRRPSGPTTTSCRSGRGRLRRPSLRTPPPPSARAARWPPSTTGCPSSGSCGRTRTPGWWTCSGRWGRSSSGP